MIEGLLGEFLFALGGAIFGGGGILAWLKRQETDEAEADAVKARAQVDQAEANERAMLSFYALWNDELKRLATEIDKLHSLVGALEAEIIALGGDPVRVRLELANNMNTE